MPRRDTDVAAPATAHSAPSKTRQAGILVGPHGFIWFFFPKLHPQTLTDNQAPVPHKMMTLRRQYKRTVASLRARGRFRSVAQEGIKVYLDDDRETPEGWTRVYWPAEAIELLRGGNVSVISLDHDLGDDERGTGNDVVLWIEEAAALRGFDPPLMRVHSANPSGAAKMQAGIDAINRRLGRR